MHTAKTCAAPGRMNGKSCKLLYLSLVVGICLGAGGVWFLLSRPSLDKAAKLLDDGHADHAVAMLSDLAAGNNIQAATLLGDLYWRGGPVAKDRQKALPYLEQAAQAGDVQASAVLGIHYYGTGDTVAGAIEAEPYLRFAADHDHAEATGILGKMYYHGHGMSKNKAAAADYLARAADRGDANAMLLYGGMLLSGDGVDKDYRRGVDSLEAAAGDPDRDFAIGEIYLRAGIPEKALPHFIQAHAEGRKDAGLSIGEILLTRLDPDYRTAVHYLKPLADAGDADSCAILADLYFDGEGVAKDRAAAYRYLQPAVDRGDLRAMARSGFMLATGDGVPRNLGKGLYLLNAAGDRNYSGALVGLGFLYHSDHYGMRNRERALVFWQRAAELGDARATDMLQADASLRTEQAELERLERDRLAMAAKLEKTKQQLTTMSEIISRQQEDRVEQREKDAAREKAREIAQRELDRQNANLARAQANARYREQMDRIYGTEDDIRARARLETERNTRQEARLDKLVNNATSSRGRTRYHYQF